MKHGMANLVVAAVALTPFLVVVRVGATAPRPPTVKLVRASLDRAHRTVDVRLRVCFSAGPRARIVVHETRTLRGTERAHHEWVVPRAVEPVQVRPFSCVASWRLNWLLEPRLVGAGTYTASIRVRDANRIWARSVGFSVTSA